jgi:hypothetical protein
MHTVRQMTLVVEVAIGTSLQWKIHKIMMLDYIPNPNSMLVTHLNGTKNTFEEECIFHSFTRARRIMQKYE